MKNDLTKTLRKIIREEVEKAVMKYLEDGGDIQKNSI